MRSRVLAILVGLGFGTLSIGCPPRTQELSAGEAQQALEESALASQAETLLSAGVDITTHFTIGSALEQAATETQAFVISQLPCAKISRDTATLTIQYGATPGACSYHGHNFAGEHSVSVLRNAANEVAVHHAWNDFNDGHVSITGSADVTWSRTTDSRHVIHDITWTVLTGSYAGQSGSGRGDRTQTPLAEGGIATGMRIDGTRTWDVPTGHFDLDIDSVEVRWSDPVPQAGAYVLTTPAGLTLTLGFGRIDAGLIRVSARSGTREFSFAVASDGRVER
jgi:hypothetical protein